MTALAADVLLNGSRSLTADTDRLCKNIERQFRVRCSYWKADLRHPEAAPQ